MSLPLSLLDLLSNTLILYQTCPYLPISGLLNLAATSNSFQHLIYTTPNVFRYLDLSASKGASTEFTPIDPGGEIWRSERMDEAVTEEDFFSGPLRGIFAALKRRHVLQDVQILILDGLSVTAEIVREIVCDEPFNVRILSIREVKNLNERKLKQVLKYICRPSRPDGTPKLKGLYFFVPRQLKASPPFSQSGNHPNGVTTAVGAQLGMEWNQRSQRALSAALGTVHDPWHRSGGILEFADLAIEWTDILTVCRGIIQFDAVLCRGPRHDENFVINADSTSYGMQFLCPMSATVALGPDGCQVCHSAPEGPAVSGISSAEHLPLLDPPPRHTSSISVAQTVPYDLAQSTGKPMFVRCMSCLADRWCEGCNKFWCEKCYKTNETSTYTQMQKVEAAENLKGPGLRMGIKRDCFGCGPLCVNCNSQKQRNCRSCGGGYCLVHNEGSTITSVCTCRNRERDWMDHISLQ